MKQADSSIHASGNSKPEQRERQTGLQGQAEDSAPLASGSPVRHFSVDLSVPPTPGPWAPPGRLARGPAVVTERAVTTPSPARHPLDGSQHCQEPPPACPPNVGPFPFLLREVPVPELRLCQESASGQPGGLRARRRGAGTERPSWGALLAHLGQTPHWPLVFHLETRPCPIPGIPVRVRVSNPVLW